MNATPLCMNCRRFPKDGDLADMWGKKAGGGYLCWHSHRMETVPDPLNYVSGGKVSISFKTCQARREDANDCGPVGVYFEEATP